MARSEWEYDVEGRDCIMGTGFISTLEGVVRKKKPKINFGFQPPKADQPPVPRPKRPKTPS